MNSNPEEQIELSPAIDDDVWVRGVVYVRHKRLLMSAEVQLPRLEQNAGRARYEYDILQRIRDKTESPEAGQDWDVLASVAHDFMVMAEQEMEEVAESAAYHRAMVAEMEADLGEKAQEYESALAVFDWDEWDEEDFDEPDLDEICPFFDECPFMYDEDLFDYKDYEDGENESSMSDAEVPF
jgi:hypothetical protein